MKPQQFLIISLVDLTNEKLYSEMLKVSSYKYVVVVHVSFVLMVFENKGCV